MSLPTDELREKIARKICDVWGYEWDGDHDTDDQVAPPVTALGDTRPSRELYFEAADAILALLPKPTDDVKALIEEARALEQMAYGDTPRHFRVDDSGEVYLAMRELVFRLAAALSAADAVGYARGIEEAAHRLTILPPTGSIPKGWVAREAWLAGHTSALIDAQSALRTLKDPT